MESTNRILNALRDVRGVEGSFYASRDGEIVSRDMPRIYDGDDLGDVAMRMSRFLDALGDLGGANEGVMIRHPNHTVFLRGTDDGLLGVLATSDVSVPALKRGASLVVRRLPSATVLAAAAHAEERAASVPPPLPPEAMASPSPEARRAVPPPIPTGEVRESRVSAPPSPPRISVPGAPVQRTTVPAAPGFRQQSASAPAVRWRGTVKE